MSTNGRLITPDPSALPTHCKLCKKLVVELRPPALLNIPLSGQPGQPAIEYMAILMRHISKHHPEELERQLLEFQEIQAWFLCSAFTHTEASVEPRMEEIRRRLFHYSQRYSYADERIEEIVDKLELDQVRADQLKAAMKIMRDILCENPESPAVQALQEPQRVVLLQ